MISDEHLAMLAASGVTPEYADKRGYETVEDHKRLLSLGFSGRASSRVPALLIPQLGVNGEAWGYQSRPDNPNRPDTGEVVKYETPHRQRNGLDFPPGVGDGDLLVAPGEALWLTEGSKKADCGALRGLIIASVSGVWNWRGRNRYGGKVAIPDWHDIALNRHIIITYDGDVARKREVRLAMSELADWLKTRGAQVSCAWLPDTDAKTGLDDYLVEHSVADLEQLVRPYDFSLDGDPGRPKRSVASTLVGLAQDSYYLGVTATGEPFGVRKGSHIAAMLRGGGSLRSELARRYFEDHDAAASQSGLADACAVLEGFACRMTPESLYLRVGSIADSVYIDIGDNREHVIRIYDGAWSIDADAPVLFRRTNPMLAMPTPVAGGDVSRLWKFVPVEEADRPLVLAWLVSVLVQPDVAHTILALVAEHGAIKSTTTKFLVALVDPSEAPVRMVPRNADSWVTAANASRVIGLDNLSGTIPRWLSDCLCRSSTGDGDVRRALYTDSNVTVIAHRRAVVFNGVDIVVTQPDLADRLLRVRLPRVGKGKRRTDEAVAAEWTQAHPHILGGLLDLAAKVHQRLRTIEVADMPRMADYARVLACVDEVLKTEGLDRYRKLVERTAAETLDALFIAELIRLPYAAKDKTAKEILAEINMECLLQNSRPGWPQGAQSVTALLTKHAPALRTVGWTVEHDGGHNHNHATLWTITPPTPADPDDGEGGLAG